MKPPNENNLLKNNVTVDKNKDKMDESIISDNNIINSSNNNMDLLLNVDYEDEIRQKEINKKTFKYIKLFGSKTHNNCSKSCLKESTIINIKNALNKFK